MRTDLHLCGAPISDNRAAQLPDTSGKRRPEPLAHIAMPGMSGLELGRLVRDHYPEIPVVLAAGYSDKAARAVEEGFLLLEKPYSVDALKRGLASVIKRDAV
jgi:CheY-like chemotaxis protein